MSVAPDAAAAPSSVTLRLATNADAAQLAAFGARVFFDTFGADPNHRPDDMRVYLAETFTPERIAAEISDGANRYLLAVDAAGGIVGYAKLRLPDGADADEVPECVPAAPDGGVPAELARLYVDHGWHGRGVGDRLMDAALERAREAGRDTIWLGVYENNVRARRFYARWGFTEVGEHHFQFASDLQTDLVMARRLSGATSAEG